MGEPFEQSLFGAENIALKLMNALDKFLHNEFFPSLRSEDTGESSIQINAPARSPFQTVAEPSANDRFD